MARVFAAAIFFCMLLVLGAATAKAEQTPQLAATTAKLAEVAQAYADVYGFSGTVKVVKHGEQVLLASYGLANREFNLANSPDVRFSINSMSKTFTAAAVLQLVEQGKLKLHTPVAAYIPELTAAWANKVTLHHLLTHSSGLPRESGIQPHQNLTLSQQITQLVNDQTLLFEPGSRYEYSNIGIMLLGRVIETASKLDFASYITEHIIKPLKLSNTGVYQAEKVVERQATPYRISPEGVATAARSKHLGVNPGGGMYSNVNDLYQFMLALEQHKLLSAETSRQMFQPQLTSADGDSHGYGWTLKPFGERVLYFAAGSGFGTKSVMLRSASQDDFIAITANWGNTPILQLMAGLFFVLNDMDYRLPDKRSLASEAQFSARLGRYSFVADEVQKHLMMQSNIVTLQAIDGKVFMNDELMAVRPDNTLRLTYTDEVSISFAGNDMIITINGNTLRGEKLQ
ncbi:MAG: beta-lactamase family protein [Chromatiaceae bacterium]|nr:beta-lactamase family protein [Chromatiaceae bacterium]